MCSGRGPRRCGGKRTDNLVVSSAIRRASGIELRLLMMSLLPTEPRICHFDLFLQQSVVTHAKHTNNERTVVSSHVLTSISTRLAFGVEPSTVCLYLPFARGSVFQMHFGHLRALCIFLLHARYMILGKCAFLIFIGMLSPAVRLMCNPT